jgi:hypothetical protein
VRVEFEKLQVDTNASRMAVFKITSDGIWCLINITGRDNVNGAHIQSEALVEDGPILTSLFGLNDNVTGKINGTLTQRNIAGEMLLQGQATSEQISDIVLGMRNGTT